MSGDRLPGLGNQREDVRFAGEQVPDQRQQILIRKGGWIKPFDGWHVSVETLPDFDLVHTVSVGVRSLYAHRLPGTGGLRNRPLLSGRISAATRAIGSCFRQMR